MTLTKREVKETGNSYLFTLYMVDLADLYSLYLVPIYYIIFQLDPRVNLLSYILA